MKTYTPRKDYTGTTFGNRVVVGWSRKEFPTTTHTLWHAECRDCGCVSKANSGELLRMMRRYPNCTCRVQHGMAGTPIYGAWLNMKRRCDNPTVKQWGDYGGRGISYCPEWADFAVFLADMGPGWEPGLTLDRIDNDGNYCPDNCRWATRYEQTHNRRNPKRGEIT